MMRIRDWKNMKEMSARLLEERTGQGLAAWKRRIRKQGLADERALRAWLVEQGVTGYPLSLLVAEHFAYPDFMDATADELIGAQYDDRPALRPILDAILGAAAGLGDVMVQARKT